MKRSLLPLLLLFAQFSFCQSPSDSIAASPADVASPASIVYALYDVISGEAGVKRNWPRMRTLFIPEGRLIPTGKRPDGSGAKRVLLVEDYIRGGGQLEKDGFFEKEIGNKTEMYGNIAQVFSTYESRRKANDEKPFMRGINSIQLWNDGKRWWIVSVIWHTETADTPIPGKYLD